MEGGPNQTETPKQTQKCARSVRDSSKTTKVTCCEWLCTTMGDSTGQHLPPVTRRRTGLRVAILLGAPVNWTAAFALRWQSTVACAARAVSTAVLGRALFFSGAGVKRVARLFAGQGRFLTSVLIDACYAGHADVVKLLLALPLEKGVDPAADNSRGLQLACRRGHVEIVELLLALPLERGVDPGADSNRMVWEACAADHVAIVKLLLALPPERGVDPAASDDEPLLMACKDGHVEIVKLLLALPTSRGCRPGGIQQRTPAAGMQGRRGGDREAPAGAAPGEGCRPGGVRQRCPAAGVFVWPRGDREAPVGAAYLEWCRPGSGP